MKKIVFMGTPDFSVPILNALIESDYEIVLVVTQPDRPKGRKKVMTPPPVKVAAQEAGLKVYQPEKLRAGYQYILEYESDLIVTAAYGQLLPNELLEVPQFGCINVHASLLPELRGGAPIHYAILQGKEQTGITIMYMAEKLDAGDILSQAAIPIAESDDVGTLHDKLSELGTQLLLKTLPDIFSGAVEPREQDERLATFASNIRRGEEEIDWRKDHTEIFNHIRGLCPWPVAYTTFKGDPLKIWRAQKNENTYPGQPGEIVDATNGSIIVGCGNHKGIEITELQPAGKKRMSAGDFLRGTTELTTGMKLGD
ncbi:Methionyl-tRNA formyltransferase [Lentibacillus sp. JNUCC-1]|uniref:methionyl-tRNA formyltransferase n=1 Tax=Lentibacillus sp. JNUCC-1 TaxID=2654513 RepID=UPI00132B304C|nr:Methionyl-tRNA formyltransferase [Lentibacillus sp. JNUCC-1]